MNKAAGKLLRTRKERGEEGVSGEVPSAALPEASPAKLSEEHDASKGEVVPGEHQQPDN
jgi:hypothetical protein